MYLKRIILLLFASLILNQVSSQSFFKITYGNLDSVNVSLEAFKAQKELNVPIGYHLDTAIVYFMTPGQKAVTEVEYRPNFDSTKFYKCLDLLVPGSTVYFVKIRLRSEQGYIFQPHNKVLYIIK